MIKLLLQFQNLLERLLPKPIQTGSRSYKFLFIPILAIVLFTGAMGLILWTLNYQDDKQQSYTLYRDTAYAKQRVLLRFSANEEALLSISKEINEHQYSTNAANFLKFAGDLIQDKPEILHIRWIDAEGKKILGIPNIPSRVEWLDPPAVKQTLERNLHIDFLQATQTSKSSYGKVLELELPEKSSHYQDRHMVFWHVTPIIHSGSVIGAVATLYSLKGILKHMVPSELNGLYRFKLVDSSNKEIANSNPKRTNANSFEHSVPIDKLETPLSLTLSSYPPPTNLTYRSLLWLVIGLSGFVLWSLWSVWQQMRERYAVQKDLQVETSFRKAMEDSMTVGVRAHDLSGAISYVNPAFCKMIGWSKEDLLGMKPPFAFWPDDHVPDLSFKMNKALSGNAPESGIEGVIQKKDGSRINTRTYVSPLIDEKGKQNGWISTIVDITEPTKVRQQLALAHERFTTVLESIDSSVSVISLQNGELLFANKYYKEHFGESTTSHLELAGNEMSSANINQSDFDQFDGFAGLPTSELIPGKTDLREIHIKGSNRWYEVRRRYISWVDGHLAQLLIANDITANKQAEEYAHQQEVKMQFASRLNTMGEMASSLAHELNQPLAAITNYCTGIANRLKSKKADAVDQDILPAIEKATAQAHRAATIIQRIRGFVKRSLPQTKITDIKQIIDDSIGLVDIEGSRHGIRIQQVIETNEREISVDPVLIQQVIVNLLKNAIDSIKSLETKNAWHKIIRISCDTQQDDGIKFMRIRVVDRGNGIPQDALERLYEPFFSTKTDGMGIGLNICRSIIESHQGRLWAENTSDSKEPTQPGCTFTILIPYKDN